MDIDNKERKITYDYTKQPSLEWYPEYSNDVLEPLPDHIIKIYNRINQHPFLSKFFPTFVDPMDETTIIFDYELISLHINLMSDNKNNIESLIIQDFNTFIVCPRGQSSQKMYTVTEFNNIDKALDDLASRLSKLV
jgi:hypothetical protein